MPLIISRMKNLFLGLIGLIVMGSCASKEDIYYLQDAERNAAGSITYPAVLIQPNDILKITNNHKSLL